MAETASLGYPSVERTVAQVDPDSGSWPNHSETCHAGHVVTTEVEYIDGSVVGECAGCGSKVYLPTVAGGLSLLRVKALVARLMDARDAPGLSAMERILSVSGVREELADLISAHAHEHVKLGEAGKLLDIAKSIMRQLEAAQ